MTEAKHDKLVRFLVGFTNFAKAHPGYQLGDWEVRKWIIGIRDEMDKRRP